MRRRRSDNPDLTSDVSGLSGWRPARQVGVLTPEEQAKLAEFLARLCGSEIGEAYVRAYGEQPGLGEDFSGWADEGVWPAK